MGIQKNRRWWQFSLQSALLLTALIATLIAWWLDHRRLRQRLDESARRIQFLETSPFYDFPASVPR